MLTTLQDNSLLVLAFAAIILLLAIAVAGMIAFRSRRTEADQDDDHAAQPSQDNWAGFEQTIIGMAELDSQGMVTAANRALCEQTGRRRDELIGTSLLSLTHPADRSQHLIELDQLLQGQKSHTQLEHRFVRPDGSDVWVAEYITRLGGSEETRLLVQAQDVTYRRKATWELARQALHDELTGLPNRAMLLYRLRAALESTDATTQVGVMFIDIDRFKVVNDSLGHEVGDRLIKHIASRLGTAVRVDDTVSRFGGDEFVILCDKLIDRSEAVAVAERIQRALGDPFESDGNKIYPTLSIGIATCRPGEHSADELLRDADAAMYRSKERGRNRIEFFDDGMREKAVERMVLESELRAAIRNEELAMFYQSIVDASTGYTVGFEALIRWHHPTRGVLSPGVFLPTAEEAGLTGDLDSLALRLTCRQMAEWSRKYPAARNLYVSSNIVPTNFTQFVDKVRDALQSTGLEPHRLLVEVVENALLDDAAGALQAIQALNEMGVGVAIDDFGTGFSSLSYLTQFRPDKLKIDRSFVMKLPEDRATGAVIQAISDMAKALDITVIAEGVETHEQGAILRTMGVPLVQGYLFAKPRSASEISDWFEYDHVRHIEPALG